MWDSIIALLYLCYSRGKMLAARRLEVGVSKADERQGLGIGMSES